MAEKDRTSSSPSLPGSQQPSSSTIPTTNVTSIETVGGVKINLMIGSISNVSVDVIINSTARNLQLDSGAISKFILKTAGPEIQNECYQKYPEGISTSEIAITKGYKLNCWNVFHLTLPPWDKNSSDSILANLTKIITICLNNAEKLEARSLAFPILGAGSLNYPIEKLPGIMYEAVKDYSNRISSLIKDVHFVIYPEDTEIVKKFKDYFREIVTPGSAATADRTSSSPSLPGSQQQPSSVTPRTNMASRENAGIKINLMIDSISNASVDVIVNSTTGNLQLNNGSISKFILNAAGPQIQDECNQKYPQGISTTKIAITKGYNLNCKNVFHLVLPPWDENSSHLILANLTQNIITCLETAEKTGARSLAFPILGAGVLKYPIEILPETMYEAVKNYSNQNKSLIKEVKFVVLPQDTEIVKKFKDYFREIVTPGSAASAELIPDTWSPMGDEDLIKIVEVTNGPEYDDIQATFTQNLPSSHITKIERIQNLTLYHRYQVLKKQFETDNPRIKVEVDGLWHGTAAKAVNKINKYGFSHTYCGKNAIAFDEGVSFGTDIQNSASDEYSIPESDGIKRIYKCSVLVGKVIQRRPEMKVLPDPYNSAVDNIQKPSIYVILRDSQAYPNYLITFSN